MPWGDPFCDTGDWHVQRDSYHWGEDDCRVERTYSGKKHINDFQWFELVYYIGKWARVEHHYDNIKWLVGERRKITSLRNAILWADEMCALSLKHGLGVYKVGKYRKPGRATHVYEFVERPGTIIPMGSVFGDIQGSACRTITGDYHAMSGSRDSAWSWGKYFLVAPDGYITELNYTGSSYSSGSVHPNLRWILPKLFRWTRHGIPPVVGARFTYGDAVVLVNGRLGGTHGTVVGVPVSEGYQYRVELSSGSCCFEFDSNLCTPEDWAAYVLAV